MGPRIRWALRPLLVIASLMLLMAVLFWPESAGWDFAEEGLEAAYRYHSEGRSDLLYDVEMESETGPIRRGQLTTRGDLLRLEYQGGATWGQDAEGTVWVATGPHEAAAFEEPVALAIREALRLEAIDLSELLTEIRGGCLLREVDRVHFSALGVPGHSSIEQAELWLDGSGRIEKLELRRVSESGGVVEQRLKFRHARQIPESFYQVRGYVSPSGQVYDDSALEKREALLRTLQLDWVLERLP